MKLLLVYLCGMFALTFGNTVYLEFKRTAETESKNRFEMTDLASNQTNKNRETETGDKCQSGYVKSKYCTTVAEHCFGSGGQDVYVPFNPAFQAPPKVIIGLTLIDTNKDQNVRVRAQAYNVTKYGFVIKFIPWHDSVTYQIGVNWMACP